MTYHELSEEQLSELRVSFLHELFAALDMGTPSYYDIVVTDQLVSDVLMEQYYENTIFDDDDFWCTAA